MNLIESSSSRHRADHRRGREAGDGRTGLAVHEDLNWGQEVSARERNINSTAQGVSQRACTRIPCRRTVLCLVDRTRRAAIDSDDRGEVGWVAERVESGNNIPVCLNDEHHGGADSSEQCVTHQLINGGRCLVQSALVQLRRIRGSWPQFSKERVEHTPYATLSLSRSAIKPKPFKAILKVDVLGKSKL